MDGPEGKSGVRGQRTGMSRSMLVCLLLVIPVVVAVAFYAAELRAIYVLQRWNPGGATAALVEFGQAVRAHDAAWVERLAPGIQLVVEDGAILAMKAPGGSPQTPPKPVESIVPVDGAGPTDVDWRLDKCRVDLVCAADDGTPVRFALTRRGGAWIVLTWNVESRATAPVGSALVTKGR